MRRQLIYVLAVAVLIGAWVYSAMFGQKDSTSDLAAIQSEAARFEQLSETPPTFRAVGEGGQDLGYVAIGTASGYGGPIRVGVLTDPAGTLQKVIVIESKETPVYLGRVTRERFMEQMAGQSLTAPFLLGEDLNGVTGATLTSRGIANAVRMASHRLARTELGQHVTERPEPWEVSPGLIVVITLYVTALVLSFVWNKPAARYATLVVSLVVMGFWLRTPISLSFLASMLLGYWPPLHSNLLWYVVVIGGLGIVLLTGRNLYCYWLCPFGAIQELLALLTGMGKRPISDRQLRLIRRGLLWVGLFLTLVFRNPAMGGFEPFATLFGFNGTLAAWLLLALLLATSIFVFRFWCDCFCPVGAVLEVCANARRWISRQWQRWMHKKAQPERARKSMGRRDSPFVYVLCGATLILIALVLWGNLRTLV